ncbi:hypothetical protein L682_26775 [Aquipseudomonas alcaligenes OT 69]|nr:hypothetical protein L682_26775 [Pseudomonas alcaligenes OT 69]
MNRPVVCEGMGMGIPCYFVSIQPIAINGETYPHKIMPIASLEEAVSFALTLNRIVPNGCCEVGQVDIDSASCSQSELKMLRRRARVKALRLLVQMSAGNYPESVVIPGCVPPVAPQYRIQGAK